MNTYSLPGNARSFLGRAEDWLDARGRGGWIAAMVLGFVIFWPVGLALLAYITWTNRWRKQDMFGLKRTNGNFMGREAFSAMRPSGNAAFDAYKLETLRRLEDEQQAFESFLQRLREAKDKQEFDAFMEDRAKAPRAQPSDVIDTQAA